MIVQFIDAHREEHGVEPICEELQVAPSTYYAHRTRPPSARSVTDAATTAVIEQVHAAFGIGPDTASELLIVAGDNIDRVRSEPAWARLCGVAPVPASSGLTTRHRLNRGGHRQANAALYRAVIVRMQHHEPTRAYVARRTLQGKTKAEIIRCLKRLLARETWALLRPLRTAPRRASAAS
ncbi:MAG: mobile element protein [Frankiales bacterium]|nr:mobile element protein [Frankiales bacterium]